MELIFFKYVRLSNACGNLLVNVDQQEDLPKQTPNKKGNVHIKVTLWCGFVTTVDVENKICTFFLVINQRNTRILVLKEVYYMTVHV